MQKNSEEHYPAFQMTTYEVKFKLKKEAVEWGESHETSTGCKLYSSAIIIQNI